MSLGTMYNVLIEILNDKELCQITVLKKKKKKMMDEIKDWNTLLRRQQGHQRQKTSTLNIIKTIANKLFEMLDYKF